MFISSPHSPHISLKPLNFALWFTLSFQAGSINVGGFLSCKKFVTHVTGFATHFGVDLASGFFWDALSMLMVPLFFLLGCFTSAIIIDRPKYLKLKPQYTLAFSMIGLSLTSISLLGYAKFLGTFTNITSSMVIFFLLAILSYVSGVQNSMISLASGLLVRTTHLTGITTDLGVGMARMLYPQVPQEQRIIELKMNLLRMGTILSFIFGSIAGGLIFFKWEFIGFLLPGFISLGLAFYSWHFNSKKQEGNQQSTDTPLQNTGANS